ncbi:MerR family transcriptional regulator [Paenibacillus albidus]|uniref:MerR family transcriptional regulator n=1 Tax=Paenibacillus albidus TaxID=2041023 RepID=UPI00203589B0|nr:MerR family transcriptional regulator [Paenibacillus albidus]
MNKTMESYSMKQFVEKTGFTEDAIRYYEKIGLLQQVKRKSNGHRVYGGEDLEKMVLIKCLKKSGMPLEEMRLYVQQSAKDNEQTIAERDRILNGHKQKIEEQMAHLQTILDFINAKVQSGKKMGEF